MDLKSAWSFNRERRNCAHLTTVCLSPSWAVSSTFPLSPSPLPHTPFHRHRLFPPHVLYPSPTASNQRSHSGRCGHLCSSTPLTCSSTSATLRSPPSRTALSFYRRHLPHLSQCFSTSPIGRFVTCLQSGGPRWLFSSAHIISLQPYLINMLFATFRYGRIRITKTSAALAQSGLLQLPQ